MTSFTSFAQFIRQGGQTSVTLSLLEQDSVHEVKQAGVDVAAVSAFDERLRNLARENWAHLSEIFQKAGVTIDPGAEDVEEVIGKYQSEFELRSVAHMNFSGQSGSLLDIETTADWLARHFATEINEIRQRRLGVTHYIWRTRDDAKVRPAHGERDDKLFAWDNQFSDGHPGHGNNCRCFADPAILNGTTLLTDVTVSAGLANRIADAQGEGLANAAEDAAVGGVLSVYAVLRFAWLGYGRLFGVNSPEEEGERLAMRANTVRAIDEIVDLDIETVRKLAEAFAEYFSARHADLRLLDLEHRLGFVSEDALLQAYREVAYMDGATTFGAAALTSVAARLGINLLRLRPREAILAIRSTAARYDGLLGARQAIVGSYVAQRFAELATQGHGPQRHEGAVTRQMLIDRVLRGIDPMTGSTLDGVRIGRDHGIPEAASRMTSEASYVAADAYLRRSAAFSDAYGRASARTVIAPQRFRIALPIEDVQGPDFAGSVEGVRRVGDLGSREWTTVDFGNGRVVAVYELSLDGRIRLITLYPEGE
jgi:Phage Mu protein F like protein